MVRIHYPRVTTLFNNIVKLFNRLFGNRLFFTRKEKVLFFLFPFLVAKLEPLEAIESDYNSLENVGSGFRQNNFSFDRFAKGDEQKFSTNDLSGIKASHSQEEITGMLLSSETAPESFGIPKGALDTLEGDFAIFSFLTGSRSSFSFKTQGPRALLGKTHFWLSDFFVKNNFPDTYDPEEFKKAFLFTLAKMDTHSATKLNKIIGPISNIDANWIHRASQLDLLLFHWERAASIEFQEAVSTKIFGGIAGTASTMQMGANHNVALAQSTGQIVEREPAFYGSSAPARLGSYLAGGNTGFWGDVPSIFDWPVVIYDKIYGFLSRIPRRIANRRYYEPFKTDYGTSSGGCSMDSSATVPVYPVSTMWRNIENFLLFDPIAEQRARTLRLYNAVFPYLFDYPNFSFLLKDVFLIFESASRYSTPLVFFLLLCVLTSCLVFIVAGRYSPLHLAVFMEVFGLSLSGFFGAAAFTYFDPIGQVFASTLLVLTVLEFLLLLTFIVIRQITYGQKFDKYYSAFAS